MGNLLNRFYQTKEEEKMDCVSRPESHDEDTISELPNEILLHILSYLASKDILKTFALSTRWNSLRSLLPSIFYFNFRGNKWLDDYSGFLNLGLGSKSYHLVTFDSFHRTVRSIPDGSRIAKFCLLYRLVPDTQSKLKSLLCDSARHKIEDMELEFDFCYKKPNESVMPLPRSLFTSDSLTSLRLIMLMDSEDSEFVLPIEFPNSVWWLPSLKTLHIEWFQDWETLILPGCPVLEELTLRCRRRYQDISIASARLQRLTIEGFVPHYSYSSLEIECPNLQSLNISNWCWCCGEVIQVCDLYSLVEANIDIDCEHYLRDLPDRWTTNSPIPELIERFRHVKSLQLSSSTLQAIQFLHSHHKIYKLDMDMDKLPIFYNLTHLELEVGKDRKDREGFILLLYILQNFPHLQSLKSRHLQSLKSHIGSINYIAMEQNCLKDVVPPPYLKHCLKAFNISSLGGIKEEIDFLRYILKNAKVLEHFTVHWYKGTYVGERMFIEQELSTLFRSDCLYDFF